MKMEKYILLIFIIVSSVILVNTASSAVCGDGICSRGPENCNTCPQDCGCESGYNCYSSNCVDYRLSAGGKVDAGCGDNECNRWWRETCYEDNCCGGKTVDFNNDNNNCGICWNACKEDYACEQGICVFNIKDDLSHYPKFFIRNDKLDVGIIVGDKAPSTHVLAQTQVVFSLSDYIYRRTGVPTKGLAMLASEIEDIDNFNIISIGNACDNEVTAKILENPEPCNNLESGEATIELYNSKSNKVHIVLNAYSDEGVKKAADVLSRYISFDLNGNKFTVDVDELEVEMEETKETDQSKSDEDTDEDDGRERIIDELNKKISSQEKKIEEKEDLVEETIIGDKKPQQIAKEEDNLIKKVISWFLSLFG